MKIQYELNFDKIMVSMILACNNPHYNQLDLFMDFHRNSCNYYDSFCDALYLLSSGQSSDILWLTPFGKPYLAPSRRCEDDIKWVSAGQLPEFEDDLADQLETALAFLKRLLSTDLDIACGR